ncbi:hypothetical protein C2845_PM12G07080 [Panicum miliaceum]|uniref:DUF4220 domain-containing protein n=1 Tax=Panicum miliaceum TaxID=4540 RepID=A0A3L6QLM7_PANMI|nr:hypothetical protein C2845_PM12G07080 [Panicum miliaceum]
MWNEWALHVLVLLSFTLQVMLLIMAEFRRRVDNGVLKVFIWLAYMLADSVAIYTIGHLSVTSKSAEHSLMVLWAPLLLVHLGGQDNITAYAVEDIRLWLRHLQTFAVQDLVHDVRIHPTRPMFISDKTVMRGADLCECLEYLQGEACGGAPAPAGMMLELIAQVWVEMLCYAGARCSAHSHAMQLSNGGELITLAAISVRYCERDGLLSSGHSTSSSV